ncbi:MAG: UDP-N-acetylmuramate--L-alanine ligase [Pseudomonadota bacterium]
MKIAETRAHFIGIGGIGMSALAQLFQQLGAQVSGSDLNEGKQVLVLKDMGVDVQVGHHWQNISGDCDVVVYSSAIDSSNPEMQEARRQGIPLIPRAEALAEVMRFKRGIAVGGTHGKTTTTSLLGSIFLSAEKDPTIAVGGRLKLIESTARLGQGPWMIAEADESDGSFARLNPEISIITNIDSDHLDHFGNFDNLQKAFLNFAMNVPYYGASVVFGDDPKTRSLFKDFPKKLHFYGEREDNDYYLKKEGSSYQVFSDKKSLGSFSLQVPGKHNALNALAACIAGHLAGISWVDCFRGVSQYNGVDRRFQWIGETKGVRVYDDYAHHPTEIRATIAAARELDPDAKLHIVYQPHRFSRTKDCWQDYLSCFQGVDCLYLLDIYPAGEAPIEGVSSQLLSQVIEAPCQYVESEQTLISAIKKNAQTNNIIMTMGAGHVWKHSSTILESFQ